MTRDGQTVLEKSLCCSFAVFVFGSTFSIALAQIALGISLVIFLVILAVQRINPFAASLKWLYISIALYITWLLFTALVGPTPLKSVLIIKEEWLFCIVPIGVYLLQNNRFRTRLMVALAVGVLIISLYGILQHFTGINLFKSYPLKAAPDYGYLVCGSFSHPLTFGNYFGTASVFLLTSALVNRRRLQRAVATLLVAAALLA
ncbi:MAG: hypothetical protein AB1744_07520, partial [Candidatus Zixiibacteriota bacterium]